MKKPSLFNTCVLAGILLLQLVALCFHAHGAAGDVDLSFDPGSGINGPVLALAVQPDGKVIIGGAFTSVKGVVCQNIARLNADGSGDGSFAYAGPNTGVSTVGAIALQSDGKVLVAHGNGLSRFNSTGGLDTSFITPSILGYDLFSEGLNEVAVQPDGKILIGGAFRIVNNKLRSGIARLHADGTLDNTFIPATIDDIYTGAFSIAVQPDGKVLIGGQWLTARDVSIARLNADGTLDGSFRTVTDGAVWAVGLQSDGKVLIGGFFALVNGMPRAGFARLGADGATDTAFIPGAAASGTTQAIAVQPDGKIVTGRYALTATGSKLTRMNTDGSVDTTFETVAGSEPAIFAVAVQADGKVLAGGADLVGNFTIANYHLLTRFHADGSRDGTFVAGGGVEGHVFSVVSQPDGKVLIGGQFVYINGTRRALIARLNADGSLDSTFNPASGGYPIVLQPDGKVLVGGVTRLHADGSLDGSFNTNTGAIGQVYSTALQPDGRIFIGGKFDTVNGIVRKNLARLNSDGSLDSTFTPIMGDYGEIKSIAVQPDGKVLVAGKFMVGEDPNIYVLCRLLADGSLDGSFPHKVATAFSDYVELYNVLLRSDGKILIGGIFRVDGWVAPGLARLHSDGSVDGTFNPGPQTEIGTGTWSGGIASQPDGKVLVAGTFYRRDNEEAINGAFRLNANGSLDGTFTGTGYYPGANVLVLQPDGNVLVAGSFLTINGVFRQSVARLSGDFQPPVSFAAWASSFGLSGAAAAAGADPDGDGLPNGAEYIFGGNPGAPATSGRPAVALTGGNMVFTFPRADASETPDVTLTVESGTDLVSWPAVFHIGSNTAASSPGVSISENAAALDTITVTIPRADSDRMFARLKVTISP